MRWNNIYNPRRLCERLAIASFRRRRFDRLRHTPAADLGLGHINTLELLELITGWRPPCQVVFDIGANVGVWTRLAKAVLPQTQVHAFEPLPGHCQIFLENCGGLEGVHLHPVALGDRRGQAKMHVTAYSDASSLLAPIEKTPAAADMKVTDRPPVEIVRLDDYLVANCLPMPDLMKLDVQGYELDVLRGAVACLQHSRALLLEVSFDCFYDKQCLFHEVVNYCAEHGFFLYALSEATPLGQRLEQADVLFVKVINPSTGDSGQ